MNKSEFLAQLRAKLAGRMDGEELKNALSYYEEYLEDAGPEREQEVLEELGSPDAVAAQVLGEQEARYIPPVKRRSHTGVIALCVGLGILFVGVALLLIFSFVGFNSYTQEPQVSVSAKIEPAAPTVSVAPVIREDGEQGYVEASDMAAFSKVTVEIGIGQIILEEGTEYALAMDWYLNSADLKYNNDSGTLKVWDARTGGGQNQQGGTVHITVPEGKALDWVDLWTGLGGATVRRCTISKGLTVFTGLGSIDVSGGFEGEIDLESGMGDIDVSLNASAKDYRMDLEAGMGDIKVDGEKVRAEYETNGGQHELDCSTGMGDIKVSFSGG